MSDHFNTFHVIATYGPFQNSAFHWRHVGATRAQIMSHFTLKRLFITSLKPYSLIKEQGKLQLNFKPVYPRREWDYTWAGILSSCAAVARWVHKIYFCTDFRPSCASTALKGKIPSTETCRKGAVSGRFRLVTDRESDDNHWIPYGFRWREWTGFWWILASFCRIPQCVFGIRTESDRFRDRDSAVRIQQAWDRRCHAKHPIPVRFRYAEYCVFVRWIPHVLYDSAPITPERGGKTTKEEEEG